MFGGATETRAVAESPSFERTTTVTVALRKKAGAVESFALKPPLGSTAMLLRLSKTVGRSREYVTYSVASKDRAVREMPLATTLSEPVSRLSASVSGGGGDGDTVRSSAKTTDGEAAMHSTAVTMNGFQGRRGVIVGAS